MNIRKQGKKDRKNFDITYLSCKPREESQTDKIYNFKCTLIMMNFPTLDFFKYREKKIPLKIYIYTNPWICTFRKSIEHCVAAFVHVAVGQKDNERPTTS